MPVTFVPLPTTTISAFSLRLFVNALSLTLSSVAACLSVNSPLKLVIAGSSVLFKT